MAELHAITAFLDDFLHIGQIPDASHAWNGLQVENREPIRRIAAAVDASERAIEAAIEQDCNLLLVHHGLFWDGQAPVTGRRYRKLRRLLDAGVAVYSAHIPLDLHPEVGNNVLLARALGIEPEGTFGDYRGVAIGVYGRLELRREALAARLQDLLEAHIRFVPGGPERIRRVGVVTGAGADAIAGAIALGLDAFVSGEGPHHSYFDAVEGGINLYYGGHWATETFGVKALAELLSSRFGVVWSFIEQPTGF